MTAWGMTYRELTVIALKESGLSDAEIAERLGGADFRVPNTISNQQVKLKPGVTERDLIEDLKSGFAKVARLSPEEQAALREELEGELEKSRRSN